MKINLRGVTSTAAFARFSVVMLCLTLSACFTGQSLNTIPKVWPKSNTAPAKPRTHLRCRADGQCEVWDAAGNRRHDMERAR